MKGQKRWGLNTKLCHKPYKFDLEFKDQRRIRIIDVLDTSSLGEWPMCQIWYANVKAKRSYRSYMKTRKKPLNLTLRQRSKSNREHECTLLMVIDPYAHQKKVMRLTRICIDRQSDYYIPPPTRTSFTAGIIIILLFAICKGTRIYVLTNCSYDNLG